MNYELLLFARVWGSPLLDTNCHSVVGDLAPPRKFISAAQVTMGGSPVAGEGDPPENVRSEMKAFLNLLAPLIVDGPPFIIRSHEGFR